jgi:hypothetical protein
MSQDIDRLSVFPPGNLFDEIQAVLPDHSAMFFIFGGNLFGGCQCEGDLSLHCFAPVQRLCGSHLGPAFGLRLPYRHFGQIQRQRLEAAEI